MNKLNKNAPLAAEIIDDKLVISIGISTLAFAIENSPEFFEKMKVIDELQFATDVLAELTYDPDGSSSIERLLDKAASDAIEFGSEAVKIKGE